MRPKISFLMAAHNEEKIIIKSLRNLLHLPYDNYEIIIGLDGCTDQTKNIIQTAEFCCKCTNQPNKLKFYELNLRQGKPAVINKIIKKAKGDIIIINDADWIFRVKNRDVFEKYLSAFDDNTTGGIAESFPCEELNKGNWVYTMVAYSSYLWMEYNKRNLIEVIIPGKSKDSYLPESTMFLTNVFRKKLYKPNSSLGDDFERTKDIMDAGYDIRIFNDKRMPRMVAIYKKIRLKDFFKQKIRTAMARKQLGNKGAPIPLSYYLKSCWYIFTRGWMKGLKIGSLMTFWIGLTTVATIIAKFKKIDTQEAWGKMRMKR